MFYTRQQVERLEKYRKTFETAVRSGFARNVGSVALKEIESIYDEAFGSHYSYNSGCSVCVLGFLKRVGEPFLEESAIYAAQDRLEAEKNNMQVVEDMEVKEDSLVITTTDTCNPAATNTCNSTPPKTNKRTRKKKVEENGTE